MFSLLLFPYHRSLNISNTKSLHHPPIQQEKADIVQQTHRYPHKLDIRSSIHSIFLSFFGYKLKKLDLILEKLVLSGQEFFNCEVKKC